MITAAGIMRPLPVRPVDGIARPGMPAPLPRPESGSPMRPLPMPRPERSDLVGALRDAAFHRMIDRGVQQPLPVVDRT